MTPTVTGTVPASGTALGGTAIAVTGTGFVATPTVTIGGVACTSVVWVSSTTLTCVAPAGAHVGTALVVVTNPDTSASAQLVYFTYIQPWELHAFTLKARPEQTS
jgi:hypothetical protein